MPMRLATRGSPLALWQAEAVRRALLAHDANLDVKLVIIKTVGDRDQQTGLARLGPTGIFTKEVDRALLEGRADIAVHSLKDQETSLASGLVLGMVLPRGPVEDVLISPQGQGLLDLGAGARVATGSVRRRAQMRLLRPDLEFVEIRGNLGSRLEKLAAGQAEALVMARAGMERLGLMRQVTEIFSLEEILPAPSQGIVGVTCRIEDRSLRALLAGVDHPPTHAAADAERALLQTLEGGCNVPVGALALPHSGGRLLLQARVLDPAGQKEVFGQREGPIQDAAKVGRGLGLELLAGGALELVRKARP